MLSFMLFMILIVVVASAGIEFLAVKSSPRLHAIYMSEDPGDKLTAIGISVIISVLVGAVAGFGISAGNGVYTGFAIFAATIIGFATNTMTYRSLDAISRAITTVKSWKATIQNQPEWVKDITTFLKFIVAIARGVGRVLRLIIRSLDWLRQLPDHIKVLWRKYQPFGSAA